MARFDGAVPLAGFSTISVMPIEPPLPFSTPTMPYWCVSLSGTS